MNHLKEESHVKNESFKKKKMWKSAVLESAEDVWIVRGGKKTYIVYIVYTRK